MEIAEARKVITSLADGTDPDTGEVFPMDSPYQQPRVIRSLYVAIESMNRQGRYKKQDSMWANAGAPWTPEEEERLRQAFDSGMPVDDLSRIHSRTPSAITARLEKLGMIEAEDNGSEPA